MYKITLIPGDGTGPEIVDAVKRVLEATGLAFEWDIQNAGADVYEAEGSPLPQRVLDSIRKNKIALKGPVTTPVGSGFRSVNVQMRQALDLFSCVRPCKSYKGARTRYDNIDIVIIRENTEDLYAGIEYQKGSEGARAIIDTVKKNSGQDIREDSGISIKPISVFGSERIVRYAFEYARKNKRRKVTAVHKANIMKFSDGLFLEVARDVAKGYPDIEFEDRIIDNMCMQLVQKPELYDVLVLPNLYGDIISDLGAGLIGGLGLAPGANIGAEVALFEAVHGSAPDIAGKNLANPTALLLSATMMLEHIGLLIQAERLRTALYKTITRPETCTRDIGGMLSTSDFTQAVIKNLTANA